MFLFTKRYKALVELTQQIAVLTQEIRELKEKMNLPPVTIRDDESEYLEEQRMSFERFRR